MTIKMTIDRFEGDVAVIKTDNGKIINWPKEYLPSDMKEGAVLEMIIKDDKSSEQEKKAMAKKILNEILGS